MSDDSSKYHPAAVAGHPAVDLAAALLRAFGHHGLSTDKMSAQELEALCEQWARHLLIGSPPPGDVNASASVPIERREWGQARRFFVDARRSEQTFINSRHNGFRDMLWEFIHGLRATFVDEQAAGQAVTSQLDHLKHALDTDSIDTLRREVGDSLTLISTTLEERRKRQDAQMQQLGEQLKTLRTELVSAQQAMALDPMTRLYNRASFDEMLGKTVELSLLSGQAACLLMVDVDGFKSINDSHGHQVGDAVISEMARLLVRTFPRKTDFVARYAGDEFVVILQDATAKEGKLLADRLIKSVRAHRILAADGEVSFTVSVGVSGAERNDTPESWLRRADEALYAAKHGGRDRTHLGRQWE